MAQRLRWPPPRDTFAALRNTLPSIARQLPADSPVLLRVAGLTEDHFNYLRYILIPRPLELKLARASRVVLLSAVDKEADADARIRRERPDLVRVTCLPQRDYVITLFKQGP